MIFSAMRWLCACKAAQAVTVSTLMPNNTREMIRFFIKNTVHSVVAYRMDGFWKFYTVLAIKTCG